MLTAVYPNGLTAKYIYNQVDSVVGLEYEKKSHCATTCPEIWYSDFIVPSVHGEAISQNSTLAEETYAYDKVGRLTETQETPTGKGCSTRLYAYDEESNRIGLTTRESSTKTCATGGGTVESHLYDSANRLVDSGINYDKFGNATEMPEADAGGHTLTSGYYVDNQIETQKQNSKTINYKYDPAGRTMETETIVGATKSITVPHYVGSDEALTWTSEEGGAKWSRNIPGIDGVLDAIQYSSGTKELQLHDLKGDIVATTGISETETKILSSFNSTEFGVPVEGKEPPKYAWLGASGISTAFGTGVATEGGASYVPQVARYLQTAPVVPPGAFPDGQGSGSPYTAEIPGWWPVEASERSAATIAEYAARQVMEREVAELTAVVEKERIAREEGANNEAELKFEEEQVENRYLEEEEEETNAHISIKLPSVKQLEDEVASGGTAAAQWFYHHTVYSFKYLIKNDWKKGWQWELTSSFLRGLIEPGLNCYKGSKEAEDEISAFGPAPGPITEFSVSVAAVVGCAAGLDG